MTPEERAVINAAIRLFIVDDGYLDEIKDAVQQLKHSLGCICPTDERVYCEADSCRGGEDLTALGVGDPNEKGSRDHLWGETTEDARSAFVELAIEQGIVPASIGQLRDEPEYVTPKLITGYAPLAERTCGHGKLTRYNMAVPGGYIKHDDGTDCDVITLMQEPSSVESNLFGSDAHGGPMSGEGPVNVIEGCDWPRSQCTGHRPPTAPVALVWHPRPLRDVRKGDVIRPAGTDAQSTVTDRYWPPTPDASDRGVWHVIGDPGLDKWAYTRDHVVQPGEVWICLDGGEPRNMAPDFAVEILLDPAEIAAVDAIGWDNRLTSE